MLLEVQGLEVTYAKGRALSFRRPTTKAVNHIDLTLRRGETLGLVGESGSGKSTTGRAILRLVEPSSGRIWVDGCEVTAMGRRTPLAYRRTVQAVFQDPASSLDPRMLVGSAVAEPLRRHGIGENRDEQRETARGLLARVGLSAHFMDRYPSELSGGQCQRVAIARSLALSPKLLICDEAVSALDVSTQSQVINLLEELQAELGLSYLFIAHDLNVVRHISHRVSVMYAGEVVETAETEQLFEDPQHPYTRRLLASTSTLDVSDRDARRAQRLRFRASEDGGTRSPDGGTGRS